MQSPCPGIPANNVPNTRPIANPGNPQRVNKGAAVTLDGSKSSDPDNDDLKYNWVQTAGTSVTLSNSGAQKPTFIAPNAAGMLTFELKVFDITVGLHHHNPLDGDSNPASVTITVQ